MCVGPGEEEGDGTVLKECTVWGRSNCEHHVALCAAVNMCVHTCACGPSAHKMPTLYLVDKEPA